MKRNTCGESSFGGGELRTCSLRRGGIDRREDMVSLDSKMCAIKERWSTNLIVFLLAIGRFMSISQYAKGVIPYFNYDKSLVKQIRRMMVYEMTSNLFKCFSDKMIKE